MKKLKLALLRTSLIFLGVLLPEAVMAAQSTLNGKRIQSGTLPLSAFNVSGVGTGYVPTYNGTILTWSLPSGGTVTGITVASTPAWLTGSFSSSATTPALTLAGATGLSSGNYYKVVAVDGSGNVSLQNITTNFLPQATSTTSGYLSSTDWNNFNNKGSGSLSGWARGTLPSWLTGTSSTSSGNTTANLAGNTGLASTNYYKVVGVDSSGNVNLQSLTASYIPSLPESQITNLTTDLAAKLVASNNLSDLTSVSTARTNLGLVASATTDTTNASNISSGTLAVARGGTGANLGLTGGSHGFVMQTTSGGAFTVVTQKRHWTITFYENSTTTGIDTATLVAAPYINANTSITWVPVKATLYVNTPSASATTIQVVYSTTGNAAFGTGTGLLSANLSESGTSSYLTSTTTMSANTVASGNLVACNWVACGGTNGSVTMEFDEQ